MSKYVTADFTGKLDGRRMTRPEFIVLHYTAVAGATARAVAKSMIRRNGASTHFIIDRDDVVQLLPLTKVASHVGSGEVNKAYELAEAASRWHEKHPDFRGNSNSVGVDLCVFKLSTRTISADDNDWFFDSYTIKRAIPFIYSLMRELNIPPDHILRHADATGKPCPRPFVSLKADGTNEGERRWAAFIQRLRAFDPKKGTFAQ